MTQRISASANAPDHAGNAAQHDAAATASEARRRAAAYIDLWERQLAHAAAQGTGAPPARRKGPRTGA